MAAVHRMRLDPGEVHVWCCDVGADGDRILADAERILSPAERARRDRFVLQADRQSFAAAHALVRSALSLYEPTDAAGWRFDTGRHGKPAVVAEQAGAPPLTFNLSHSRRIVAVVVARAVEVGIDIEDVARADSVREIATRHFAPREVQMLNERPGDSRMGFVELWTLKEAYLKAVGTGLSGRLDSIALEWDGPSRLTFRTAHQEDRWHFVLAAPAADHRLAVAIASTTSTPPHVVLRPWTGGSTPIPVLRTS